MNLPKNKDGKLYLLNKKGEEVIFNHPVDVQEALFGIFGKDNENEEWDSEFSLPENFDMKIRLQKSTGNTKEEKMLEQIKKKKPGRPPKSKEPEVPEEDEEVDLEENFVNDEG
jgi:hypothetical protein